MYHKHLYSELMAVIQDEVCIRAVPKKYGSQYRKIKDLIFKFESVQQYIISKKQKKMIENSNQNQISCCIFDLIHFKPEHQSNTDWEMKYSCCDGIIFNFSFLAIAN